MKVEIKQLPKSLIELTIEIPFEDFKKELPCAAEQIAKSKNFAGFRPGKAPYDIIRKEVGEMALLEIASEKIIRQSFYQAIKENNLETIGQPEISVQKLATENPLIYIAKVSLLPEIKLPNWKKIKIEKKKKEISGAEIEKVITDLRKMNAKEVAVDRAIEKTDKVAVDMDILMAGVPVEGGQSKNYIIYMDENFYLPGLTKNLLNHKAGEELNFSHEFPTEFYNKTLAGKKGDFKVKIKSVHKREIAETNDDFAKTLGQKTTVDLQNLVKKNLQNEADQKENQRTEIEMLQKLINDSSFGEIPEILINSEKQKMFAELKAGLQEQGVSFEDYLRNLKKTEEEISKDFSNGAEERAKTALVLKKIAKEEKINISPEEFKEEKTRVRELYKENEHIDERLENPEIQDFIAQSLLNRKVMAVLKQTMDITL